VITLKYKNLTDKHNQVIYVRARALVALFPKSHIAALMQVAYKVSLSAHLKKPLAVATAFIFLFSLAFGGRRVKLSLHNK
jgi:oligosaccharyltransferase complex subunit alpha (ribophorin I)